MTTRTGLAARVRALPRPFRILLVLLALPPLGAAGAAFVFLGVAAVGLVAAGLGAISVQTPADQDRVTVEELQVGRDLSGLTYRDLRGTAGCSSSTCAGHEAGWRWAADHDIAAPDDCGGRSQSFEEGCRAWAEESQAKPAV